MLEAARQRRAAELSGGQQQMLEMGRALLLRPRLMLLDEPTLGLAPLVFREIFRIIEDLRRDGQTILMVEQNAVKALEISDYAYVLELGTNRFDGSGEAIRNDERIRRLYLGRCELVSNCTPRASLGRSQTRAGRIGGAARLR